jgi:hypothetical protein
MQWEGMQALMFSRHCLSLSCKQKRPPGSRLCVIRLNACPQPWINCAIESKELSNVRKSLWTELPVQLCAACNLTAFCVEADLAYALFC